MKIVCWIILIYFGFLNNAWSQNANVPIETKVCVVGGGLSGTMAAIQLARLQVPVLLIEESPWLGGMISAAGVAAIDGNQHLASGLWKEFRDSLYKRYGGADKIKPDWRSFTVFEPHIADEILKNMVRKETHILTIYHYKIKAVTRLSNGNYNLEFNAVIAKNPNLIIQTDYIIEATELGEVLALAKIPFDLGLESDSYSKEQNGLSQKNDIVQDITMVAILKDYGHGADKTILKPDHYNPLEFDGAFTNYYIDKAHRKKPTTNFSKMLENAQLPNNKYLINWPNYGNDTYIPFNNLVTEYDQSLKKAKETTKRFIYFIQHQLGYKNLGLADDEFLTSDKLPYIPYIRESRRVKGLVRFNLNHITHPFNEINHLYRTGIAVGDFPIDIHHTKNANMPHINLQNIPSFNVPLGSLMPFQHSKIIVAEKSISVSNIVNGCTRLQPVVMLIGQAAGVLAAECVIKNSYPQDINLRHIQKTLLSQGAYIMPYYDISPQNKYFLPIQKIGATGILRGKGISHAWTNQTWFYPDSFQNYFDFLNNFNDFLPLYHLNFQNDHPDHLITLHDLSNIIEYCEIHYPYIVKPSFFKQNWNVKWHKWQLEHFDENRPLKKYEIALILIECLDLFELEMDFKTGNLKLHGWGEAQPTDEN